MSGLPDRLLLPDYVEDGRGPTVTTYPSRTALHPFDPDPSEIFLVDIAHQLSLVCRFGGACSDFYSVAQHSVKVLQLTRLLEEERKSVPRGVRQDLDLDMLTISEWAAVHKFALMHDAEEYVFGDMVAPVKSRCPDYQAHAAKFRAAIFLKYGIDGESPRYRAIVKFADRMMRRIESVHLHSPRRVPGDEEVERDELVESFPAARGLVLDTWTSERARHVFLAQASLYWPTER